MADFIQNDEDNETTVNQILKTDQPELDNLVEINEIETSSDELTDLDENNLNYAENFETKKIELENANKTNCLALTIKEEHKLVAVKNVFLHSLKVTWKVVVSTIALHILKIFF